MKNTGYTFAVARIRCNENKLLNAQDYSSVITASSYAEAVRRLADKGYEIDGTDYSSALREKAMKNWELISSVLPDKSHFDSIIIKNDFANLKLVEKAFITEKSTEGLFTAPSVYAAEDIKKAVFERNNSALPEPLRHADRSAYRILTKTHFAQLSDTVIDRASMEWGIKLAKKNGCHMLSDIAQTEAAQADIKALYRCILTGKAESFMDRAVCECSYFDKKDIIKAAASGMENFLEFLRHTELSFVCGALKKSSAEFERQCDNKITDVLRSAKTEYFNIAPLAAFYYASETEIKNVRIILSAKLSGLSENIIKERVRESYV